MGHLPEWRKGEPNSAAKHNQSIRRLNQYTPIRGGPGLLVKSGDGTTISLSESVKTSGGFWGRVIDTPSGRTALTDERYYVEEIYLKATGDAESRPDIGTSPTTFGLVEDDDSEGREPRAVTYVVATNLNEAASHTHALQVGAVVWVSPVVEVDDSSDGSGSPVLRFVFTAVQGGGGLVPCGLVQTGGSNGNVSTAPTWTYTVTNLLTGEQILTGAAPQVPLTNGNYVVPSYGTAYHNGSTWVLYQTLANPETDSCLSI